MKQLQLLLLMVVLASLGVLVLKGPSPAPEYNVGQAPTSEAIESVAPQSSEAEVKPAAAENQLSPEKTTPNAVDTAGLYEALLAAYKQKNINLEIAVLKDSFNEKSLSDIIKKINQSSNETNYFISQYHYQTRALKHGNYLTANFKLEYKEVLAGRKAENVIKISSYPQFEELVKQAMQQTTETIEYEIINKELDYNVKTLLQFVEKVAEANRGNYVDQYSINSYGVGGKLTITYFYTPDKVQAMKAETNAKAEQIISSLITPEMSALEKETALHDFVVLNTKYDKDNFEKNTVPKDSYTAYGVLIKGIAVCEGYAAAMDVLLNKVGIESKIITGNANNGSYNGPHAWNLVKIDDNWLHLDATWDDPVPDHAGMVRHDYFNLTEAEMKKDHTF